MIKYDRFSGLENKSMKKNDYEYILWDFDGTVMDSAPGIIASAKYALSCYGIIEEDYEVLRTFIGPPLRVSFPKVTGCDDEMTEKFIQKYRQYYHAGAMYECEIFPGIAEAARAFRAFGYRQYIATSKPKHTCEDILRRKGIYDMFDGVFGSTEDGRIDSKLQVLEEAFRVLEEPERSSFVLIGDTVYDAQGAKQAGIDCIGITFGNGSRAELEENGAAVFDSMQEVCEYIMGDDKEYKFYGSENALCFPADERYAAVRNPRHLYDLLCDIWSIESCAPRLRDQWSEENKTLGQCSITSFLVQDIFAGEVYAVARPGGTVHCYNEASGCTFDLTSEQFGDEKLCYENILKQSRQEHFADADKRARYEYLKKKLDERLGLL